MTVMHPALPYGWPDEWPEVDSVGLEQKLQVVDLMFAEASRLVGTQLALINSGVRHQPDTQKLRLALGIHRAATMVEKLLTASSRLAS